MYLAHWLTQSPTDRPVAWVDGQYKSERHFFNDVAAWKRTFEAQNIQKAVVFSNDTYRFACILFGAWQANIVTILPADITDQTIERLKKITALFVTDRPLGYHDIDNIIEPTDPSGSVEFHALDPDATLVEMFTSGSTGVPTRIVKHLRQLFEDIEHLDAHFANVAPSQAIVWSTVPHQHIYGFLWRLLWPLASGRFITQERLLYPETILERLSLFNENILVASPAHLKRLPNDLPWERIHDRLQMITSSGGPLLDDGLRTCFRALKQTPYEIFGSTELDGIAWRHRRFDDDTLKTISPLSSLWHPMPGVTIKADEYGLLWIRSLRLENLNWTAGSDLIEQQADGRFSLQKRVDRIVKIEEKRVSLDAMESEIKASGLIAECKAFLLEQNGQERLVCVAAPSTAGQSLLAQEGKLALVKAIRRHLVHSFEALVLPHRWRFEPQLPVDARGKHSLAVLQTLFDARYPQLQAWTIDHHAMTITIHVPANTPHFEGHFPNMPVLPGVTQLDWIVHFAHRLLQTPLGVKEVKNLKFQALLLPQSTVVISAKFHPEKMQLDFEMRDRDDNTKRYSSGRILFRIEG